VSLRSRSPDLDCSHRADWRTADLALLLRSGFSSRFPLKFAYCRSSPGGCSVVGSAQRRGLGV